MQESYNEFHHDYCHANYGSKAAILEKLVNIFIFIWQNFIYQIIYLLYNRQDKN